MLARETSRLLHVVIGVLCLHSITLPHTMVFLLQPDFDLVAQLVLLNIDGQSPQNSDKKLASQVHLQALPMNPILSLQCCKMASLAASLTFTSTSPGPSPDSTAFGPISQRLLTPASLMKKSILRMLIKDCRLRYQIQSLLFAPKNERAHVYSDLTSTRTHYVPSKTPSTPRGSSL